MLDGRTINHSNMLLSTGCLRQKRQESPMIEKIDGIGLKAKNLRTFLQILFYEGRFHAFQL